MSEKTRYKITALLGRGAMGTVYKAVDQQIDREVAIKVLHPHLLTGAMGEELSQRFKHEVKAAARCQHPNIVTVYDYGLNKGAPYMVMEYVKGVDLQVFLKTKQVLSAEQAINLILKVLDALSVAHAMGVVHRDIKPANIMLLENGQIKVTDFGVARIDTSELTQVGDVMGTPCYMSPEARQGETTTAVSDLYTTALVLLELLIKKRLQIDSVDVGVLSAELQKQGLEMGLVARLTAVMSKALQTDPKQRYQDAIEFSKALASCLEAAPNFYQFSDDLAATVVRVQTQLQTTPVRADSGKASKTSAESGLLPEDLSVIEKNLTGYLGPVAKVLIKKHSQENRGVDHLLDSLMGYLPSEMERRNFLNGLQCSGISKKTGGSSVSSTSGSSQLPEKSTVSTEYLEQLTTGLTHYLGPIAKHLVKAAQKNASSKQDLCELLAQKIPNDEERNQFLNTWVKK